MVKNNPMLDSLKNHKHFKDLTRTSVLFIFMGAACIILGWAICMFRPSAVIEVPDDFIHTTGIVASLGEPVMGLPDDARPGDPPISMQRVIISYKDAEGNPHTSQGFIATGSVVVGSDVPVKYDPKRPGSSHRMVGKDMRTSIWKFLIAAGILIILIGCVDLKADIKQTTKPQDKKKA